MAATTADVDAVFRALADQWIEALNETIHTPNPLWAVLHKEHIDPDLLVDEGL